MRPEDVPDDLVALLRNCYHIPGPGSSAEDWARCILANTLPEHERKVRATFAGEVAALLQEMREEGNVDLRTPIHTLRDIARGAL